MASHPPLELEVTISSAKDLKNINWKHGDLKPYVVLWVDPKSKCSTRVDELGDTCPIWDETLVIPLPTSDPSSITLYIDVVQANAAEDIKPLIGSTKVPLYDIIDDVGIGEHATRSLKLKRPSGRPQGKIEVKIMIRQPRYRAPDPYYAPPYGVPPPGSRDPYSVQQQPQPYGYGPPGSLPYGAPPPSGYPYNPQPYGGQPQAQPSYGGYGYGGGQPQGQPMGYGAAPQQEKKKDGKFGVGTGIAVGAVAGVLGGLAIAEGVDYVEDKIEDDVAEKVEDDLAYDDGGYDGDDF